MSSGIAATVLCPSGEFDFSLLLGSGDSCSGVGRWMSLIVTLLLIVNDPCPSCLEELDVD